MKTLWNWFVGKIMRKPLDFNGVLSYLDSIPNINNGGCGIAALAIYRWLKKNQPEKECKITFLSDNYIYSLNCEKLKSNILSLVVPSHIVVEIDGKFYDSDGEYPNYRGNCYYQVKEDHLITTINCPDCNNWNDVFKRKHTKSIAKTLGIDLSDVNIKHKY